MYSGYESSHNEGNIAIVDDPMPVIRLQWHHYYPENGLLFKDLCKLADDRLLSRIENNPN